MTKPKYITAIRRWLVDNTHAFMKYEVLVRATKIERVKWFHALVLKGGVVAAIIGHTIDQGFQILYATRRNATIARREKANCLHKTPPIGPQTQRQ